MNAARKNVTCHVVPCTHPVFHVVFRQESMTLENGRHVTNCVRCIIDDVDYVKGNILPTKDQYSLKNMLENGDMPQMVRVNGMLDTDDPASPEFDEQRDGLLNQVMRFDKRSSKKLDSVPSSSPVTDSVPSPSSVAESVPSES